MFGSLDLRQESQYFLTEENRRAIRRLSIGVFLEYFDLMLYVHVAVLVSESFFPKANPLVSSLFMACTFCSTFVFRPIGALFFNWASDCIGRKTVAIMTTIITSFVCIMVSSMPVYDQIGYVSTKLFIIFRIVQSLSYTGDKVETELYFTETIKPPAQYPAVSLVSIWCALGAVLALGIASIVMLIGLEWRAAFWVGAVFVTGGLFMRASLIETTEFTKAKCKIRGHEEELNEEELKIKHSVYREHKISNKTVLFAMLLHSGWPMCMYLAYMHPISILRNSFSLTPTQVINQNFWVAVFELVGVALITFLSSRMRPMLICRTRVLLFIPFVLLYPHLLNNAESSFEILVLQGALLIFAIDVIPAYSITLTQFPIFRRFNYGTVTYLASLAITYVICSFGFIYMVEIFGHNGVLVIVLPVVLGFFLALNYFQALGNKVEVLH